MFVLMLLAVALAFTLSASAGLGGSLILIPVMSLMLGSKIGIAVSAVLLGCNNVFKAVAYRRTIPIRESLAIVIFTMIGTGIGSLIMIRTSEQILDISILVCFALSFLVERKHTWKGIRKGLAPLFALSAGLTSGFTGTSGPLKGMSLRSLNLNRFYFVGAASVVSMAGDLVKSTIFFQASLFDANSWRIVFFSLFIMPVAVYAGKFINEKIGERAYATLFWLVMTGYSIRLLLV